MTKTKQAIKDSIKGGYPAEIKLGRPFRIEPESEIGGRHLINEELFLDPNFWQCLGKTKGWKREIRVQYNSVHRQSKDNDEWIADIWMDECFYQATRYFQDYAMKGRSSEEYFEEIYG